MSQAHFRKFKNLHFPYLSLKLTYGPAVLVNAVYDPTDRFCDRPADLSTVDEILMGWMNRVNLELSLFPSQKLEGIDSQGRRFAVYRGPSVEWVMEYKVAVRSLLWQAIDSLKKRSLLSPWVDKVIYGPSGCMCYITHDGCIAIEIPSLNSGGQSKADVL